MSKRDIGERLTAEVTGSWQKCLAEKDILRMGNKMSYIYAMSDIHGCLDAFEYALSLVDFSGDNKLIFLGDYIHGPDSYGVLKKVRQLQNR